MSNKDDTLVLLQHLAGDSSSEEEAEDPIPPPSTSPTPKGEATEAKEDSDDDSKAVQLADLFVQQPAATNDGDDKTSKAAPLLSAEMAINSAEITFKERIQDSSKQRRTKQSNQQEGNRSGNASLIARQGNNEPLEGLGLPSIAWHVPLAGVAGVGGYIKSNEQGAQKAKDNTTGKRQQLTVKEKEKLKRQKGQSSQHSWKPEEFMKLKQTYD